MKEGHQSQSHEEISDKDARSKNDTIKNNFPSFSPCKGQIRDGLNQAFQLPSDFPFSSQNPVSNDYGRQIIVRLPTPSPS